jgi:pimeloyl-ACP methyl ester carboxylesterase
VLDVHGRRHDDPAVNFTEEEGVLRSAGGRKIGWMLRGTADGPVIGWFHGQPGSRRDLRAFTEETLSRYGVRMLAVDRAGYGDTSSAGLDRRDVARDLLTVADHLGLEDFPIMAVSMGGAYALALAAIAPERISKVVLVSVHVLPYDDPAIVAGLSAAEQADVARLLGGRTPELEAEYAAGVASMTEDPMGMLRGLARGWGRREQSLVETPMMTAVAESVSFGLAAGHLGLLEDGLRTVSPLEFELSDVRCPVRAIHGMIDDLEPYANLQRAAAHLTDCVVVALPGMGHFGPWLWPDSLFGLVSGH